MIKRLKALFRHTASDKTAGRRPHLEPYHVAAAAVLVEAAQLDSNYEAAERVKILDLLTLHFGLESADSEALIAEAEQAVAEAKPLQGFTRAIKDAFDHDERVELLEMLWEVAYADGYLHDYEASLIRRVTGLLHVSDRESGAARKRALDRMGIDH